MATASELQEHLEPVFENPGSVPSPILLPNGLSIDDGTYVEHPVNPVGSEHFKESVRSFIDKQTTAIADYRTLTTACERWCSCFFFLSRLIVGLFAWAVVVLALVALDKNGKISLPDWAVIIGCTLTALLVMLVFVVIFVRLHNYSTITRMRLKHGEL